MEGQQKGGREINDQVLIQKVLSGNDHAFRLIVEKYQQDVFKAVFGVLRNQKDAEDTAQEVFVKLYTSLSRYENQGFKTWMMRIAVNHAIDVKRKKDRFLEEVTNNLEEVLLDQHQTSVEIEVMLRERRQLIRDKLGELPDNYREVIYGYYIDEKSYQELANDLNVQVKTIEMKLYRARQWIRKHWKEDDFL